MGPPNRDDEKQDALRRELDQLRRELEEERARRREAESQLQLITGGLSDVGIGVDIVDSNYQVLYQNPYLEGHFGNLVATQCYRGYMDLDEPCPFCPMPKALESGKAERVELQGADGRHYLLQTAPIPDFEGPARRVIEVVIDITAQKRAIDEAVEHLKKLQTVEEQLRVAQKMEAIGRLAGGVAHDFNNMLGAIIGFSDLMLEALHEGDPLRRNVEEITKAAQRAAELTKQLLAFSRKQVLQIQPLDLNNVVLGVEGMLRRLLGANIQFRLELDSEPVIVEGDAGQLEQVLMNLVVNARDAMPKGGTLSVQTSPIEIDAEYASLHPEMEPGSYLMLAVSDTGIGMDPGVRSKIFEPFFTTKGIGQGTGLGLSTVYGIVRQTGGHITVYSEPDHGTVFKVLLPRSKRDRPASRPLQEIAAPETQGTECILVAEDETVIRRLVFQVLTRAGYTVAEANNGDEALLLIDNAEAPFDLLITDVVMPGMNGRELGDRISREHPTTRVLYMSGYIHGTGLEHGTLLANDFYLQKPFTAQSLLVKVRDILDSDA